MKKRTSKVLLTSLMLILTLSVMALLTGCGGPSNLEEYINDNPKEQESLDSFANTLSQSGMDVKTEVKENTITISCKVPQTIEESQLDATKSAMEQYMETMKPTMQTTVKQLEENTEIKGIVMKFIITDAAGTELCNSEFKSE